MASTQTKHPWRATVRTVFAAVVAAVTLIPVVAAGLWGSDSTPALVTHVVVVSGVVTRILARPQVNDLLERFVPWLAAAPAEGKEIASALEASLADANDVFGTTD